MSLKDVRVSPNPSSLAHGMQARPLRTTAVVIILALVALHFFASVEEPFESWFPQSRNEIPIKKSFEWKNVPQTNDSSRIERNNWP
jgi:hypothetical protein